LTEVAGSGLTGGPQGVQAQHVQDLILDAVHDHAGDAAQSDDITLMVVVRNGAT
jgi:hypothetical protein